MSYPGGRPEGQRPDTGWRIRQGGDAAAEPTTDHAEPAEPVAAPAAPAATAPPGEPAKPVPPGDYKAKGDPYTYRANADGSITIVDGPTGEGTTLPPGDKFNAAIMAQMRSGQLKREEGMPQLAPDRPEMNTHLDESLAAITGDSIRKNMGS